MSKDCSLGEKLARLSFLLPLAEGLAANLLKRISVLSDNEITILLILGEAEKALNKEGLIMLLEVLMTVDDMVKINNKELDRILWSLFFGEAINFIDNVGYSLTERGRQHIRDIEFIAMFNGFSRVFP